MRRLHLASVLSVPFVLAAGLVRAQDDQPVAPPAKAAHVFVDGEAQVVDAFKNRKAWIREFLFVETSFDSDHDGKPDRMHVDVIRPAQTKSEGLKVPVVYETSPYFMGTGPSDLSYYHDVRQELGGPTPPRPAMPPIPFSGEPGMIGDAQTRAMLDMQANRWLQRGYAVVHSCSPGTGWSQGCPSVGGPNESLAPMAVIEWLCGKAKGFTSLDGTDEVKAEWCNGKVGMTGTSYNGGLPIAAATTGVAGLAAIIPVSPPSSWYRYYRSQGLVRSPGGYLGEDMDVLFDFIASCEPKRREWCIQNVRDKLLVPGMDRVSGDYNDFWAVRDYLAHLDKYHTPTLAAHGFNDWNVMPDHSVDLFVELKKKGVPCMVYLHQGGHGGEPPFKLMNRWFTRFLFGVDNGVERDPKAWIVRENDRASAPTPYADYPNPEAKAVALFPQRGGNAVGALALAAAAGQGVEVVVDDASRAGSGLAGEAQSPHRLLFALPKLTAPLHVSGTPRLKIRVAADKPACNLSVWLVALPITGGRKLNDDLITRGWADPQNHKSLRAGEPLVPGTFYDLEFDLQPDDQVVAAGEQVALMIMASDNEFTLAPKPGTKLSVDLDATRLLLPVVGGEAALQKALAADGKR